MSNKPLDREKVLAHLQKFYFETCACSAFNPKKVDICGYKNILTEAINSGELDASDGKVELIDKVIALASYY